MIAVVGALTVLVGLLTLFVLGLLRSHAQILSRLDVIEASGTASPTLMPAGTVMRPGVVPIPDTVAETIVVAIDGFDCDLAPYHLAISDVDAPYLLVAFLSTTCFSCLDIWRDMIEFGDKAAQVDAGDDVAKVMIVLKGREHENLGKAVALAAETRVPVVFSSTAWSELGVPGSPYFMLIATADQRVVGAGSATNWDQLRSLASDAMLEIALTSMPQLTRRRRGYRSIIEREDDELRRAGIYPGHPSLHPGQPSPPASPHDAEPDISASTPIRESIGNGEL